MTRQTLRYILFCSLLALAASAFAALLSPPTISIAPDIFYPQEEALSMEGRAPHGAAVQILLQQPGEEPIRLEATADEMGAWSFSRRLPLTGGYWEVRLMARDAAGNESPWTSGRTIRAVETGVEFAGATLKFSYVAVLLLFLLAGGLAFFIYSFVRARGLRKEELLRSQRQRIKTLERRMHEKEVAELRQVVRNGFESIKQQKLSHEEISKVEDAIEKELRDLEDEVHP